MAAGANPSSGERERQALGFLAVSLESLSRLRQTIPAQSHLPWFSFTGAVWAPFHLLGKQREVRSGIVQLPCSTGGKLRPRTQSKTQASRLFR